MTIHNENFLWNTETFNTDETRDSRYIIDRNLTSRYQLQNCIGRGTYSLTYRVINKRTRLPFCLKKIHDAFYCHKDAKNILREVIAMHEIFKSPLGSKKKQNQGTGITFFRDGYVDDKDVYIIMPLKLCDLRKGMQVLESDYQKEWVCFQIAWMVWELHEGARLIHRDLKPENILMDEKCNITIADLGLVRDIPDSNKILNDVYVKYKQSKIQEENKTNKQTTIKKNIEIDEFNNSNISIIVPERNQQEETSFLEEGFNNNSVIQDSNISSNYNIKKIVKEIPFEDSILIRSSSPTKYHNIYANVDFEELITLTDYVGNIRYRAPEIICGSPYYSTEVDIWSIGCMIAEIYLGFPLFQGKDSLDQLKFILRFTGIPTEQEIDLLQSPIAKGMIESVSNQLTEKQFGFRKRILSSLPSEIAEIVESCLKFNPKERIKADEIIVKEVFKDYATFDILLDNKPSPPVLKKIKFPSNIDHMSIEEIKQEIMEIIQDVRFVSPKKIR